MVYADQAPVLTIFPPTPSLFHPPPELNERQRDRPITRFRLADGKSGWLVTRYEDVRQVPTDPTEHTRPRRLIVGAFTARRVEALRPRVTDVDTDLVEEL
ncbi:hypothetical protein [Streptomyces cucumeris]|uniref:hypothetical protein n=1 Tax=Streptomyces cucumeris TaxID=2962890 RepID=UPI0020C856FB|nr:hypothetical protein [Streptomyces sp. NEAU-Y11]MCP9209743.1 hypothetical protein [Streptomyces sp. NEAU-Y11]